MNPSPPDRIGRVTLVVVLSLVGCGLAYLDRAVVPDGPLLLFALPLTFLASWRVGWGVGLIVGAVIASSGLLFAAGVPRAFDLRASDVWRGVTELGILATVAVLTAQLRAAHERERLLARLDPLTEIDNSRSLAERVECEHSRAERMGRPVTLAYFDCNRFKELNDTRGHLVGDDVLRKIAAVLKGETRVYDVAARVGGDEFVLLLPDTDAETARLVVDRVHADLLSAMREGGWSTTFSIGVVTFDRLPESSTDMLRAADELMYEVKRSERAGVAYRVVDGDRVATE